MKELTPITFVTVNYNSTEKVIRLVKSIQREYSKHKIIIVDNASSDGAQKKLKAIESDNIKCIFNCTNLGYGKANNIGVAQANTSLIALINPDTELIPGKDAHQFFSSALENKKTGIIAPKIIYPDGTLQPNFSNRYSTISLFTAQLLFLGTIFRAIRKWPAIRWLAESIAHLIIGNAAKEYTRRFTLSDQPQDCLWVSGACIGIRKDVYHEIGGFDERFFLYSEDEDLCRRARSKGYKILYDPALVITHEVGGTQEQSPQSMQLKWGDYHRIHSGLIYLKKYNIDRYWIITKSIYICTAIIGMVGSGKALTTPFRCTKLIDQLART
jgi:GT2 family glycosyltransferase